MDKAKGTTNNRAIDGLFRSLHLSFTIFFYFLLSNFFLAFALLIFFLSKKHTRTNHKKIELNWIKDVVYKNQDYAIKSMTKLVGPETRFS